MPRHNEFERDDESTIDLAQLRKAKRLLRRGIKELELIEAHIVKFSKPRRKATRAEIDLTVETYRHFAPPKVDRPPTTGDHPLLEEEP